MMPLPTEKNTFSYTCRFLVILIISLGLFTACSPEGLLAPLETFDLHFDPLEDTEAPLREFSEPPVPTLDPAPIHGGSFTLSMNTPKTLHPLYNTDESVDAILSLIFEPIILISENLTPMANPKILHSADFSADGLSLLFKLKEDIFWHDGTPITADDFLYTLNILKPNEHSPHTALMEKIQSFTKIDTKILRIEFSAPSRSALYAFTFPIIPKHHYELTTDQRFNPLGNGAFEFSVYNKPFLVELIGRNTYIEKIECLVVADIETSHYAFEQGKIDALTTNMDKWAAFRRMKQSKYKLYDTGQLDCIGFNYELDIFKDKEIRQALAYLLPMEEIFEQVYLNDGVLSNSAIHPNSLFAKDNRALGYDPEMADDRLPLDFHPRILVNEESKGKQKIASMLQKKLRDIGRDATIVILPFPDYIKHLEEKNYDLAIFTIDLGLSQNIEPILTHASIGFDNQSEALESLWKKTEIYTDVNNLTETFRALHEVLLDEMPIISIAFHKKVLLTDLEISGMIETLPQAPYNDIETWYIETPSQ